MKIRRMINYAVRQQPERLSMMLAGGTPLEVAAKIIFKEETARLRKAVRAKPIIKGDVSFIWIDEAPTSKEDT